ncbi:PaaI family thioesterase [Streptomyces sp. NBC_00582]|uniref:PaaI family thioesterase n=1 Tax=Streptomyces sp. NBC_00582 TaxID=2975783 RepID=UPI001AAE0EE1|nr:hotdog fold domain-containing protein [Streptomyces sp. NBC_00582]WUB59240.1 hotdog fold thioesterase [Streptomyces sp. NBC_00582]
MSAARNTTGEEVAFPWDSEPSFNCFGCSPRNPIGLKLRMKLLDNGDYAADTRFPENYASYPGIVHGGIVNVLVDEVMGDTLALVHGMLAFTVTLRSKMFLPLRVGEPYLTVARITGRGNGVLHTEAEITGPGDELHVMATGTYQPIRSEQAKRLMGLDETAFGRIQHYFDHGTTGESCPPSPPHANRSPRSPSTVSPPN